MRFLANGPSIPGELLAARDEGQVIFFCGSGVSKAKARLPDFYGLATSVVDGLGAAKDSRARAIIEASKRVGRVDGVGSLVPADRVFAVLEEEFSVEQVRRAVAAALRPDVEDLDAHRIMLDLARGTDGAVRVVTTNFDPLFELADPNLASHGPPDLPDPSRASRFNGIVHLHGRVGADYVEPLDDEFVLSSADFGRAYLADGWAARFIRALLARYQIVFVGYAADDPPVQYLLEALGKPGLAHNRVYAFQAGDDDQARALWAHKGVRAIPYNDADGHRDLWDTLAAWAQRARDPEAWRSTILRRAKAGPAALDPHERGQVAHVAYLAAGAKEIARLGEAFPAEWVCVFDPHSRYAMAGREDYDRDAPSVDPFELWGLDGDVAPPPADPDKRFTNREAPEDAWSAFVPNRSDHAGLDAEAVPRFYGGSSRQVLRLPRRLSHLGNWIADVAHEPAILWWAANKVGLHPDVAGRILRTLERNPGRTSSEFRDAWRQLLRQSEEATEPHDAFPFHRLNDTIKVDGWSAERARRLASLRRPQLRISRSAVSLRPPAESDPRAILYQTLRYPMADVPGDVPDEYLEVYERALCDVLDEACELVTQVQHGYFSLGPFTRDGVDGSERAAASGDNLTALFLEWIGTLERLAKLRPSVMHARLASWELRSAPPFVRARIWAAGRAFIAPRTAGAIFVELDDDAFWDGDHQRDLLHTLAARWSSLPKAARRKIERRLRAGPPTDHIEVIESRREYAAWCSLERIQWLHDNGCAFDFDLSAELSRLRAVQPRWTPEAAREADESTESRVRNITTDSDPKLLSAVSLDRLVASARAATGRRPAAFVEAAPFDGLVSQQPARALAALRRASLDDAQWGWRTFLYSDARKADRPRLRRAIATALLSMDHDLFAPLVRGASRWFEDEYDRLAAIDQSCVDGLWNRLIDTMQSRPESASSGVVPSREKRDWTFEAINSPAGRLAELAIEHSTSPEGGTTIMAVWLDRLSAILGLPGDLGLYGLVVALRNVSYLYHNARPWADEHLLRARCGDDDRRAAFWSGIFRSNGLTPALFKLLGPELVTLAADRRVDRDWNHALAAFLLLGWSGREVRKEGASISSEDLREALLNGPEELRLQALGTSQRWLQQPKSDWSDQALELLGRVWPRQTSARSQPVSNAIARHILAANDLFPRFVAAGVDLVSPVGRESMWMVDVDESDSLAARFPEAMLKFLTALLPENAEFWPHRTEHLIEALSATDRAHDPRLQDLRRRLANR